MSDAIVNIVQPTVPGLEKVEAIKKMCEIASYSGFLRSNATTPAGKIADAFFVAMYGLELGIAPMTALQQIYVIDGRPACSAQLMLSLMRRAGFEFDLPDPATITTTATIKIRRPGGTWKTYSYTLAMAKDAHLLEKKNWKKNPREMLLWRAVTTGGRIEGGDIINGLYTIEELDPDAQVDAEGNLLVVQSTATVPPPPLNIMPSGQPTNNGDAGSQTPTVTPPTTTDPKPHFLATEAGKDALTKLFKELADTTGKSGTELIALAQQVLGVTQFSQAVGADGQPLSEAALHAAIRKAVQPATPKKQTQQSAPAPTADAPQPQSVTDGEPLANPTTVEHVIYANRNKQTYLAFLPFPWHPHVEIRVYGRSDSFKKAVGDDYYNGNGFADMKPNTEKPYDIEPLEIAWEIKGTGDHQYMVAKANGIRVVTEDEIAPVAPEAPAPPKSVLDEFFS